METTDAVETDYRPWWLRLRSAVLLAVLLALLGLVTAVVIGAAVVVLTTLLDQALG